MSERRAKRTPEAEAREKEFWQDHENYDSEWARSLLNSLVEFVPFVFEPEALERGVPWLYQGSRVEFPPDTSWTDAHETLSAGDLIKLPIVRLALALRAYAYYGLTLDIGDRGVDDFLSYMKMSLWPVEFSRDKDMAQTITAALARQKLDRPNEDKGLTPEELAALARVSRKSIMNLLAPGSHGALETGRDGRITIASAQRWLLDRPDFRASIWHQQRDRSLQPQQSQASFISEPLFVPVASDGSRFLPTDRHHKDGKYYVGNGVLEEKYEDYWAALEFLTRATSPRWRWSDAMGRWRTKSATDWRRTTRQDIEALLPAGKMPETTGAERQGRKS